VGTGYWGLGTGYWRLSDVDRVPARSSRQREFFFEFYMKVDFRSHGMEDFQDGVDGGTVGAVFQFRDLCFLYANELTELFLCQLTFLPCGFNHSAKHIHTQFVFVLITLNCSNLADVAIFQFAEGVSFDFL